MGGEGSQQMALYQASYLNVDLCVEGASSYSGTGETSAENTPSTCASQDVRLLGVFRHHLWQSLIEGRCWWQWWVLMTW